MEREELQRRLEIHRSNLRQIEEQLAYYGIEPPVFLVNRKEFEQRQISEIEDRLAQAQFTTQPSEYKKIGDEILDNLEIDDTRLGKKLSVLREEVRDCLDREEAWKKVPTRCESAYKLCDEMQGSEELREWNNEIDLAYAEGIFHAYEGISHLYQADKKEEPEEESAELEKAIDCLEKSYQSFRFFEYRDEWNQSIIYLNLGRLLPFKVLPILIDEIAAGKEKPASDDIIGYMRQIDGFEFEFEGQVSKADLLKGSQLKFLPEYNYVAMLVSGDSMDQAGISSYDCVILQKQKLVPLEPSNRDIVAVVFRDEADNRATLKRIVIEPNRVILKPESSNPAHKPRTLQPKAFAGDNPSVAVVGIARAVLKLQSVPLRIIPIIHEIAAGKEKPVSDDDIIVYIQRDEFGFEFEGKALKAESLRGSQLRFLPEYDYIAMQVSGDSMDEAGIAPNQYVILRRESKHVPLCPISGDIVAVVFRDEDDKPTLKRFYFDKSSGSVTLKPESSNPEHKTRVLRPEAFAGDNSSVEIVGIAIAVLKP